MEIDIVTCCPLLSRLQKKSQRASQHHQLHRPVCSSVLLQMLPQTEGSKLLMTSLFTNNTQNRPTDKPRQKQKQNAVNSGPVGLLHGHTLDTFYSAPQCSHCKRCTSYGNSVRLSVCLSVCLSNVGIVSKRLHVARCSLHCQIANVSSFVETKKYSPGTTPSP